MISFFFLWYDFMYIFKMILLFCYNEVCDSGTVLYLFIGSYNLQLNAIKIHFIGCYVQNALVDAVIIEILS